MKIYSQLKEKIKLNINLENRFQNSDCMDL